MGTRIHLKCDGCNAETYTAPVRRIFHSFNGKGYGFGRYEEPNVDKAVEPTGWVWSDLIGCTYCPTCWAEINSEDLNKPRGLSAAETPGVEGVNEKD